MNRGRRRRSYPGKSKAPTIILRQERIEDLLGVALDGKRAERLLHSIGLKTTRRGKSGSWIVIPPSSRPDISREADVIEELARLHGYDNIPSTLPWLRSSGGKNDHQLASERKLRALMAGEGLAEVINLPFTTQASQSFVCRSLGEKSRRGAGTQSVGER